MERARVFWMCGEYFVVKPLGVVPLGVVEAAGALKVDRRLEIVREWALVGRPGAARWSSIGYCRATGAVRRLP